MVMLKRSSRATGCRGSRMLAVFKQCLQSHQNQRATPSQLLAAHVLVVLVPAEVPVD